LRGLGTPYGKRYLLGLLSMVTRAILEVLHEYGYVVSPSQTVPYIEAKIPDLIRAWHLALTRKLRQNTRNAQYSLNEQNIGGDTERLT
jgi:hypothetical protein